MAAFKCKMCGGSLEIIEGLTVCECEYCSTKQTVPNADSEKKLNLFNRANRLRSACEFDKAAAIYESIVSEFPEESEAYWGLCLCKFGIEYVDDPKTAKKIPTCHRTSYTSIFDDNNFDMACEYADSVAVQIYRNEAKEIDRLQKEILSIAKNEKPFDIFICYKESDENGQRTIDSELAHDLYDVLTEKGYKVFYARITLKSKLGQDYEPYIFSALNSAKVMLAIGTSYEYYNAVWVKNEWSRYLSLMLGNKEKILIPCYKGIDAYDIPKEFNHLQAQDLGSPRAFQDLITNIEKIIPRKTGNQAIAELQQTATVNASADTIVTPLLKRAFLFLEDGEWENADNYCEQVLNQEPENAMAYLGKLMVEMKVHKQDELPTCDEPFEDKSNFKKALRFADDGLEAALKEYTIQHEKFLENKHIAQIYDDAINTMNIAKTADAFYSAAELFKSIPGFKNSDVFSDSCLQKAEEARENARKKIYDDVVHTINNIKIQKIHSTEKKEKTITNLERSITILESIAAPEGKNESQSLFQQNITEQVIRCKNMIKEVEAEFENQKRREEEKLLKSKKKKRIGVTVSIILLLVAVCVFVSAAIIGDAFKQSKQIYEVEEQIEQKKNNGTLSLSQEEIEKIISEKPYIREDMMGLYAINSDLVGWINIGGDDKIINNAVVQTTDNDKYLTTDFYGGYSFSGTVFADYRAEFADNGSSPNFMVLYGSSTYADISFSKITRYYYDKDNLGGGTDLSLSFYQKYPTISFDTLAEEGIYKVFAVCLFNTDEQYGEVYNYLRRSKPFDSKEDFNSYILDIMDRSVLLTDVDLTYGDEVICLSTSYYPFGTEYENVRCAVFARKVREGESPEVDTSVATRNYFWMGWQQARDRNMCGNGQRVWDYEKYLGSSADTNTVTTTKPAESSSESGFIPDPQLIADMEQAAYDLLPENYKVYQYLTMGMKYKEEPYGNLPENGFYICVNDDFPTFEALREYVHSIYTTETAEKLLTNPFGNGPVYGDNNGKLGLSIDFKVSTEPGLSWTDVSFVCTPVSKTECNLEVTLKDTDGNNAVKEATMMLEDGSWKLTDIIG